MFLTPAELVDLTGYKRSHMQRSWLRDRSWVFEVDGRGRPKVLRSYVEGKMGSKGAKPKQWEPDFSDLVQAG